jgi:hypothetical protein
MALAIRKKIKRIIYFPYHLGREELKIGNPS